MRKSFICMFAYFISVFPAVAQGKSENPVKIKSSRIEAELLASGEEVYIQFIEMTAANDLAARQLGQIPIVFSESLDKVEILEARTVKADGEKLDVQLDAIRTELMPGAGNFPMFNDMRRMVIIFPSVAAGDSVVYRLKRRRVKPYFPGYFMNQAFYLPTVAVDEAVQTVRLPPKSVPQVENHGLVVNHSASAGGEVLEWRYANDNPIKEDRGTLAPLDRFPRVLVSTFPDWQTLSRAYASMALPKVAVTPEIEAKAEEITKGATSKRDEVERLYNWVTTEVRYVALFLGMGGIEPHESGQILANRYGDCKDHAVLFAAMLKARGIDSELVLINGSNGYSLPQVPTIANFNHMITYVPSLDLYLDTTSGMVRFGQLPLGDYGKPVLHVTAKGAAPTVTPLPPPDNAVTTLTTDATLAPDGTMTGNSTVQASGLFADLLRRSGTGILSIGLERGASQSLSNLGQRGEGSFDKPDDPHLLTADYRISGRFSLEARPEILEGEAFSPPAGHAVLPRPGDLLNGALFARTASEEATMCLPGRQISILSLTLPPGRKLASLPKERTIAGTDAEYSVHWQQQGDKVTVRREYVSRTKGPLCAGSTRVEMAKMQEAIRADYRTSIALTRPGG